MLKVVIAGWPIEAAVGRRPTPCAGADVRHQKRPDFIGKPMPDLGPRTNGGPRS
jgi:hypothetical protein